MKPRASLLALALGLTLALPARSPRASELVVVEARGIALNAGDTVDSTKPLVLKEGQHVTLIDVSGATFKIDGPYDRPPGARGEARVDLTAALQGLVLQQGPRLAEAGTSRAGTSVARLPDAWLLDVSRNGNVCLREGMQSSFWRAAKTRATALTVMPDDRSWKADAEWPAGADRMAVPGDIPIRNGATYLIALDGAESAVTFNIVPASLASDPMRAAWMAHVGCEAQAEALARTIR